MFRKIYKNANQYIKTEEAKKRVIDRISLKHHHNPVNSIITAAACFIVLVTGISAYWIMKPETPSPVPLSEKVRTVGEPVEKEEYFNKVKIDPTYEKTEIHGITVYKKHNGIHYEFWFEKDGEIKKIETDTPEEINNHIN